MNKYEKFYKQSLTLFSLLFCSAAMALPHTYSPQQLTAAAEQWLQHQLPADDQSSLHIAVTALDNRIGDKACDTALQFELSQAITQRQNTIQVRCTGSENWLLYVPVRIDEIVQAVIVQQNISAGSLLTTEMLTVAARERRFVRGSLVLEAADVLGARTKRSLSMGQILTFQDLCLVCKGDVVTISVNDNALSVAATGIAQSDGSLGDTISVLNQQSKRAIIAKVVAVNLVEVKI